MNIVGYTYQAEVYCPGCISGALRTGPGEEFDGWALADGVTSGAEENLDEIAAAFGINRQEEWTFDSGDFPKVIFSTQVEDDECADCGDPL